MKIEKISENIIKVTISLNDLEERNIDLSTFNYNSPATQELFWDMMEQAEIEFGFNVSDSQLIIEPVTDADEGFIITITRMDTDGDFESIQKYIKSRMSKKDLKSKKRSRKIYTALLIYAFDSIDDVAALCTRLADEFTGSSSLYKYRDTYYLGLTVNGYSGAALKTMELKLSDYGRRVPNVSFYEGYLNEYGEKIVESNAVQTIKEYFG